MQWAAELLRQLLLRRGALFLRVGPRCRTSVIFVCAHAHTHLELLVVHTVLDDGGSRAVGSRVGARPDPVWVQRLLRVVQLCVWVSVGVGVGTCVRVFVYVRVCAVS